MNHLRRLELPVVKRTNRVEPIGTGSYANVYEVMVHGTRCAAKEMHPILMSETKRRAFLDEYVRCSRILHPNVVQFLGIHYPTPDAQLPWLVMELMYISLTGLIEKYENEDFPFHFKLFILIDTCQGVQFLHSQNIVHRDLSSNNILLTKHLVAKVSDLGVAKAIPPGLQRHTMVPGTTAFMSPEALLDNPEYGLPMDVFSIGCVCIHLVSMKWPIPKNQVTAARTILSEIERRENYLAEMIHYPALNMLTKCCLQDQPRNRPTIAQVIEDLKTINSHGPNEDDNILKLFLSFEQQKMMLNGQLSQKDEMLRQFHSLLWQKDQQLFEKDQLLSEKNRQLVEKDQILYCKDQLLIEKDEEFLQRLHHKNQEITEKDQFIHELSQKLDEKNIDQEAQNKGKFYGYIIHIYIYIYIYIILIRTFFS